MATEPRWSARELKDELDRYEAELRDAGKARNTINTYIQHPERFIGWLEGRYRPVRAEPYWEPQVTAGDAAPSRSDYPPSPVRASRYDPLKRYLAERREPLVHLSFAEIERIIGGPLPPSAYRHRPWWANERSGSHVHARSWIDAGRRTANVDLNAATADFVAAAKSKVSSS